MNPKQKELNDLFLQLQEQEQVGHNNVIKIWVLACDAITEAKQLERDRCTKVVEQTEPLSFSDADVEQRMINFIANRIRDGVEPK